MNREEIIDHILLSEGSKYTNRSSDRGGPTKYGITIPAFKDFLGRPVSAEDISHITRETAVLFYQDWYERHGIDKFPASFRLAFIDTITNNGYFGATMLLQKALQFLGQTVYPDGYMGPKTMLAVNKVDAEVLLDAFLNERQARVEEIVRNDPSQAEYLQGWTNRINRLRND